MIYQRQKSKFTCMNTCNCGKPWVHTGIICRPVKGGHSTLVSFEGGACAPGAPPLPPPMQAELSVMYLQILLPLAGELKKGALGAFWFYSISSLAKTCFFGNSVSHTVESHKSIFTQTVSTSVAQTDLQDFTMQALSRWSNMYDFGSDPQWSTSPLFADNNGIPIGRM